MPSWPTFYIAFNLCCAPVQAYIEVGLPGQAYVHLIFNIYYQFFPCLHQVILVSLLSKSVAFYTTVKGV